MSYQEMQEMFQDTTRFQSKKKDMGMVLHQMKSESSRQDRTWIASGWLAMQNLSNIELARD